MCCYHDKRLRVFHLLCDRFPQYLSLFCFFVLFRQNGRLFVFLRNIPLPIEILKIDILEYFYPPSQYFFVNKAFIRFSSCRRKVALCQSGRIAHTPRTSPHQCPYWSHNTGLSSSSVPVLYNQSYKSHKKMKFIYSTSTHYVFTNGIILHLTAFHYFHKICTMRSVLDKIFFLTTSVVLP